MTATDVDGFNLEYAATSEIFLDSIELVGPELQRRGVYETEFALGSLRRNYTAWAGPAADRASGGENALAAMIPIGNSWPEFP